MIKKLLVMFSLIIGTAVVLPLAGGATVFAANNSKEAVCEGVSISQESGTGGCSEGSGSTATNLLRVAINIISMIIGVAAIIMIMVSGFRFITAQGDAAKIKTARSTVMYAVVGLVIAGSAQFLVRFVLTNASDASGGTDTYVCKFNRPC